MGEEILKNIQVPNDILTQLEHSLLADKDREQEMRRQKITRLQQGLTIVRRRLDQADLDKLDGQIKEEFRERKSAEWRGEEQRFIGVDRRGGWGSAESIARWRQDLRTRD